MSDFHPKEQNMDFYTFEEESFYTEFDYDDFSACEHSSYYNVPIQDEIPILQEKLSNHKETFSQAVLRIIAQKDLLDTDIYKKAHLDRKLFSKLRTNSDYQPSRNTALALALSLELNLNEFESLINKAGYALSDTLPLDCVIRHCIEQEIYNIFAINELLFTLNLPLLK